MTRPAISVCIPVYNGASFVGQAIASVLAQTHDDLELVIVDNCSTDGTVRVVEAFADSRIRLLRNDSNIGLVGNWNRALSESRGEFVKIMAHDDLLYPECLKTQVEALRNWPGTVMVTCKRDIIDERGGPIVRGRGLGRLKGVVEAPEAIRAIARMGGNPFGEGVAVTLNAEIARSVGLFSDERPYLVDLDFWARTVLCGPMYAIPETLCAFRVTASSLSSAVAGSQGSQVRSFIRTLRSDHPEWVARSDVSLGSAKAGAMRLARSALYASLRTRKRFSRQGKD